MRRSRLLPLAIALGLPSAAQAFGVGYGIEMHQIHVKQPDQKADTKLVLPVHRLRLIDTSGLFATIIASARYDRDVDVNGDTITTTETFSSEYTPMPRGIRVALEYAWYGGDVDAQEAGGPVLEVPADFGEFRFTVGALLPLEGFYVDFDLVDIVLRDLSTPAYIDHGAWNIDFEIGRYYGPIRAGVRSELDLISAVDAAFDDLPLEWALGVASYFDFEYGSVALIWRTYTRRADDRGGTADGRSISLGAHVEFL